MQLERQKVYDPFLRLLHWIMALSIVVLLGSAWFHELFEKGPYEKAVWLIHIYTGYILSLAFGLRLLWGLIGPKHARWSSLWHPRAWLHGFRTFDFKLGDNFGHHPMASMAYVGFYILIFIMIVTGIALAAIEHSTGPLAEWLSDSVWYADLFEDPHETISIFIVAFIVVHIGGMILHERLEKIPISQAMISGYQYRKSKKPDPRFEKENPQ